MKTIVPDYYHNFKCLMGACRHSCCVGWEIDIDDQAMERFRGVSGSFGQRLKENIDEANGCFRMGEGERCPFLNGEGLCDLILELGEESLCQICADHPRYRNFFSDREELGLGLCCEAAGRLILGCVHPVAFTVLEDDGGAEFLYEEEVELLDLRDELIMIAQNRSLSTLMRAECILDAVSLKIKPIPMKTSADFLLSLERLDAAWTLRMEELKACSKVPVMMDWEKWELPFEQLMVYLLNRHLPGALDDGDLAGRIAMVVFIWKHIRDLCALHSDGFCLEDLVEICRLYSSEIEYSDENIGAILDWLQDYIEG